MDQLKAMKVFQRVAERGSLTAASLDLGLSRGGASAVVAELEKYLGVQLIERTTRSLRLTEDGQYYLEKARAITEAVANLEDEVGSAERQPRGRLRVQIPAGLAALAVAPALPEFLAAYPQVDLEILSRDGVPDFVGDEQREALVELAQPRRARFTLGRDQVSGQPAQLLESLDMMVVILAGVVGSARQPLLHHGMDLAVFMGEMAHAHGDVIVELLQRSGDSIPVERIKLTQGNEHAGAGKPQSLVNGIIEVFLFLVSGDYFGLGIHVCLLGGPARPAV